MQPSNDNTPILISIKDAAALTSLSRTSINNLRNAGNFPAEVILGEKRVAFVRAEVIAWIDSRPRKAA
jgi:prophage regulatory protein